MIKKAWPYIGSTEHEMGSMSDSFKDTDQSASTYSFAPDQSNHPDSASSVEYSEGRVSPVEGDGAEMSLADDDYKVSAEIEDKKAFTCNVAANLQDKIFGLQRYSKLEDNEGLLFPYKEAQDVMYHMGTVSFPIDIIFIDNDNRVKKFYSNIQPGTLATFGCADVRCVLEVAGGQSDQIGLKIGDKLNFSEATFEKKASINLYPKTNFIHLYNFDGIIKKNPYVWGIKEAKYNEDNIQLDTFNNVFTPGEEVKTHISKLDHSFKISKASTGSLRDFLKNSQELRDIYLDMKRAASEEDSTVIFSTKLNDGYIVASAFISKLKSLYGDFDISPTYYQFHKDANHINLIEDIRRDYPNTEIKLVTDGELIKSAGTPISASVKQQAREALKYLEDAEDVMDKSLENLKKNMSAYEPLRQEADKVKNTKGQYFQSVKRNVVIVKQYLVGIRDGIKILNNIKDATTTLRIIENLAASSQNASDFAQEIFDLIDEMDTPDFVMLLTEKTANYEKGIEDLKAAIETARDYINKDVLGIIVISK